MNPINNPPLLTTGTTLETSTPNPQPPEEYEPIEKPGLVTSLETLLRHPGRIFAHLARAPIQSLLLSLLVIAGLCSVVYGFVVGTFSGGSQLWSAPLKVFAGMLGSALICLPSLYIFACLGGAKVELKQVCGLVAGMLALTALLLVGFAPVAWVFSQSTESVAVMGVFHIIFWFVSAGFGLGFLSKGFRRFENTKPATIELWIVIFVVVSLQMSTALRPIIGTAPTFLPQEKKFFLMHWADSFKTANATKTAPAP